MTASASAFDVVVVGCGAAGAASAWHTSRRGLRVLALDRFEPGHRRGSSHGSERIVRLGHADPAYVRFALDALARWDEVEAAGRVPLLTRSGAVDMGFADELAELERVTVGEGVRVERLDAGTAARRWSGVRFDGDVLFQPAGGTVHADRAVSVLRRLAVESGAEIRSVRRVDRVEQREAGVTVHVDGERIDAGVAVVTAGAWSPALLAGIVDLPGHRVTQEQLAFFRPRIDADWPALRSLDAVRHYGMVTPEGLVKVAEHHTGPIVEPDRRSFEIEPVTWARLVDWVREWLPGVDPEPVDRSTCLYASTPQEDFVLDRVGDVVVGAGLSGHGFKFVPEIGHRLADLAQGQGWPGNPFAVQSAPLQAGVSGHK